MKMRILLTLVILSIAIASTSSFTKAQQRTEAQRRAIWNQLVLAEDKANNECYVLERNHSKYGDVPAPGQLSVWEQCQQLLKEAREQVAQQHRMTLQELQAIMNEAAEKQWPLPPEEK